METLLVVSAEPHSIHFAAFDSTSWPAELSLIGRGHVVLDGADIEFFAKGVNTSHPEIARSRPADGRFSHDFAMARLLNWLGRHCGRKLKAIGHRVAFGCDRYPPSMPVTDRMLNDAAALIPARDAHCLATMRYLRERLPGVPQVACFAADDSASVLPTPAAAHGDARTGSASADALKSIAVATLRCAVAAPVSAVIHRFPTPAPAAAQREIAAVARYA